MDQKSDEELLNEFNKNPERAFRIIYERYSGLLFRFIYRFTVNSESAEELLHDIFVQLLTGKFKNGPDSNLKSWLFTLAKNKSLNHLKKKTNETQDQNDIENFDSEVDLEQNMIHSNLIRKLSIVETTLPKDLKDTWNLRRQGMDYQQISNQLEIPVGTVKSRFSRLVDYLKAEFSDETKN
ncbi:MAG: RNA polymerase sigma factor [Bdellovibrio sp.]|nr:RNA polymerase sigma factor [Bdellovibrio sp.]